MWRSLDRHRAAISSRSAPTTVGRRPSAVEHKLEIPGDSTNQLSKIDGQLAARVPAVGQIVGFRSILIHGYAHVDDVLVWRAIDELPELRAVLAALLDEPDDRDR